MPRTSPRADPGASSHDDLVVGRRAPRREVCRRAPGRRHRRRTPTTSPGAQRPAGPSRDRTSVEREPATSGPVDARPAPRDRPARRGRTSRCAARCPRATGARRTDRRARPSMRMSPHAPATAIQRVVSGDRAEAAEGDLDARRALRVADQPVRRAQGGAIERARAARCPATPGRGVRGPGSSRAARARRRGARAAERPPAAAGGARPAPASRADARARPATKRTRAPGVEQRRRRRVRVEQRRRGRADQAPAAGRLPRIRAGELPGEPDRAGGHARARRCRAAARRTASPALTR